MSLTPPVIEDDFGNSSADYRIVPTYTSSKTYSVGAYVRYGNAVYRCIVAITVPEQWTSAKWSFKYEIDSGSSSSSSYDTKTCKLVLTYRANGASGTPPSNQTASYSGEKKAVTLKKTVQSQGDLVWADHYFLGWSTTSNATEADIYPGDVESWTWGASESGKKTITLYAVWNSVGRIVYKPGQYANEASQAWHDKWQGLPSSGNVTLKGQIFTRTGYTISGWLLNNNHFADVNASVPASSFSSETVLYPEWQPKSYTLWFKNLNDDGTTAATIQMSNVVFDSTITIPGFDAFQKNGYHIAFWNEAKDGTGAVWFPGRQYIYNIDRNNLTLFAQWSGNEYPIVYCKDEETANTITVSSVVDCPSIGLDNANVVISTSEDYSLTLDSNNMLALNPATLTLNTDSIEEYSIATYGSPFYTDYRPYKENYTFNGWMTSSGTRLTKKDVWMDSYSYGIDATWNQTNGLILYPIWSTKYPFGRFFFGRVLSTSWGIIVNEPPSYYWPERPYDHKNVRGKNGDIIIDPDYYKNVSKSYAITAYDKDDPALAIKKLSDILHRYNEYKDYVRLEDSYEPDIYMLGIYEESNKLESILGQAWKTEITFSCKPQKFLLSGNRKIDIVSNGIDIVNPTSFPALPIIQIWGTGTIYFSGRPTRRYTSSKIHPDDHSESPLKTEWLSVYSNYNQVTIDMETCNVTDVNGNNINRNVYFKDRIALYPGNNHISYKGEIEKISIIPRWWRL